MKRSIRVILFSIFQFLVLFSIAQTTCQAGYVTATVQNFSTSIYAQNSVGNVAFALEASNATFAELNTNSDYLILELPQTVSSGDNVTVYFASKGSQGTFGLVSVSTDGVNYSSTKALVTSVQPTSVASTALTFSQDAKYVKIVYPAYNGTDNLLIDALSGSQVECFPDYDLTTSATTCKNLTSNVCLDSIFNVDSLYGANTIWSLKASSNFSTNGYTVFTGESVSTEDCCDNGSLTGLTFKYTGNNTNDNSQVPMGKASITTYGSASGDVLVIINGSTSDTNSAYVRQVMSVGDLIELDKVNDGWSNPIVIHILSTNGSTEYQVATFHTSCSAPVIPGESFGYVDLFSTMIDGEVCGNIYADCYNTLTYFPDLEYTGEDTVNYQLCITKNGVEHCEVVDVIFTIDSTNCNSFDCGEGAKELAVSSTGFSQLSSLVTNPANALGSPDGLSAKIAADGYIIVNLAHTMRAGSSLSFTAKSSGRGSGAASGIIQSSSDGVSYNVAQSISTTSTTLTNFTYTFSNDADFIRIKLNSTSAKSLSLDGISFTGVTCVSDYELELNLTTCTTTPIDVCLDDLIPLDSFSTGNDFIYISSETSNTGNGYLIIDGKTVSLEDCCDNGSLTGLTFQYTGVNLNDNSQVPMGKASVTTYGSASGDVLVIINGSTSDTNSAYVRQVMSVGDLIGLDKVLDGWSNPVSMHILSTNGSTEYQVATFHTSCSAPVIVGESYGYLTLYSTTIDGQVCGNSVTNDCINRLQYFPGKNFSGTENISVNVCYDDRGVQICNAVPVTINVRDSICEKLCPIGFVEEEVPNTTTVGILSSDALNPNNAIGPKDGVLAKLANNGQFLVLTLNEILAAGDEISIFLATLNGSNAKGIISISQDGETFVEVELASVNKKGPGTDEYKYTFGIDVQYIKIELDPTSVDDLLIDGSKYLGTTCVKGNAIIGTVWHDENADTIINVTEIGEPGVTVNLYNDANGNGILEGGESTPIQTTITGADGTYDFSVAFDHALITTCKPITTSTDDAEETPTGYLYTTSTDLEFAYESQDWGDQIEGLRFHHLGIPADAQLQEAYIQFAVDETTGSLGTVTIKGDDVANSTTFTTSNKISDRTETTSSVTWNPDYRTWDVVHEQTADQRTPDLSEIIQEIISNTGWNKDNGITFLFSGTGEVVAESYNGAIGHSNASLAPELCVSYYEANAIDNYIVKVDETTIPLGSNLTTDNIEVAEFTSTGNLDSLNDFGYVKAGSIAGNVSEDKDGGVTSADNPLENVLITLVEDLNNNGIADVGEPTRDTLTDQNGNYAFILLDSGNYLVIETQPTDFLEVEDGDRSDDGDATDLVYNQDNIIAVTLTLYEEDLNNDFIEEKSGRIEGRVFQDTDQGTPSEDVAMEGVTITLVYDLNENGVFDVGEPTQTTTTDATGKYVFDNLPSGQYLAIETQPRGYSDVRDGDRSDDGDAFDKVYNTDNIIIIELLPNEIDKDNNFIEEVVPGVIEGNVSTDDNGGTPSADSPLDNVTIKLYYDANDNGIAEPSEFLRDTVTDIYGNYQFTSVDTGNYIVVEVQPTGLLEVEDGDRSDDGDLEDGTFNQDNQILVFVNSGETDSNNDFIEEIPGSIAGNVSEDTNGGTITANNPIAGVEITLVSDLNSNGIVDIGEPTRVDTTDASGNYLFENVRIGDYLVVETQPRGMVTIQDGDKSDDGDTYDGYFNTDDIVEVTITNGENDTNNDFIEEVSTPGAIEGSVAKDTTNGTPSSDEPLENVVIKLYEDLNNNGIADPTEYLSSTLTDANGEYSFTNLETGAYVVVEEQPAGLVDVQDGDESDDGDAQDLVFNQDNKIEVYVNSGETDSNNNFIEEQSAAVYGNVSEDTDAGTPSADQPIEGVIITLTEDLNSNGVADLGEPTQITTTDVNGDYKFEDLKSGDYVIVETQPRGLSSVNDGDRSNDGDVNDATLNTDDLITATLNAGENDTDNDFIEIALVGKISGVVAEDTNGGTASKDNPIASVSIALFKDANNDGIPQLSEFYAATATNANGAYSFSNVVPGNYIIQESQPANFVDVQDGDETIDGDSADGLFDKDNLIFVYVDSEEADSNNNFIEEKASAVYGNVSEDTNGGSVSADDPIENVEITLVMDLNSNGVYDTGEPYQTTLTNASGNYKFENLNSGDYIIIETQPLGYSDVEDGDRSDDGDAYDLFYDTDNQIIVELLVGESDSNNDFIEEVVQGKITGNVSEDTDGGAPTADVGINNTTILLYKDANNNGIADPTEFYSSKTTNGDGNYTFDNLDPGYYVVVEIQPSGLVSVQDGDISVDGDATDSTFNTDDMINVYVNSGETDSDNNFIESVRRDYGDLPIDSFGFNVINASNTFNSNLYLGADWDNEIAPLTSINADGDDNAGDDEDGFMNPTVLVEPDSLVVFKFNATNNTGSDAYLVFFVDADNNKVFDADEKKEVTVPSTTSGSQTVYVSMTIPSDAVVGQMVYSRVRLSAAAGATATGAQEGGEIEDYFVITPVPVTLISFTAQLFEEEDVLLTWTTASELNNDRFEIERRMDNETEFTYISTVAGNGTTNEIIDYTFVDETVTWTTDVAYYRLRQVDFNGEFEYTAIIAVSKGKVLDITIYPNPTKNTATVTLVNSTRSDFSEIRITDMFGADVTNQMEIVTLNGAYTIDATPLRNGTYLVEIITGNDRVVKRLTVTR